MPRSRLIYSFASQSPSFLNAYRLCTGIGLFAARKPSRSRSKSLGPKPFDRGTDVGRVLGFDFAPGIVRSTGRNRFLAFSALFPTGSLRPTGRAAYISRFFRQWAEMGSSNDNLRSFLAGLFRTAVSAAPTDTRRTPLLPALPSGQLILLAAGKAAGSMAETAEAHYLD